MEVYVVTALDHKSLEHEVLFVGMSGLKANEVGELAVTDLVEEANKGKNPAFPPLAVIHEVKNKKFVMQGDNILHEITVNKKRVL